MPAKAGFSLGFTTTKSECGLLLTDPVQYRAYEPDEPFRDWIKEHGREKISQLKFDDPVSDHGLFLVTQVYCTPHCKVAAVLGANEELSVQCTGSALDGQKLSGKGDWGMITGAGVSQEFKAEDGTVSPLARMLFCYDCHVSSYPRSIQSLLGAGGTNPAGYSG